MADKPLHKNDLASGEALFALGALTVRQLLEHGQVTFFLNEEGIVEYVPPEELAADALPEAEALHMLMERGYEDEALGRYLRGRDFRARRR